MSRMPCDWRFPTVGQVLAVVFVVAVFGATWTFQAGAQPADSTPTGAYADRWTVEIVQAPSESDVYVYESGRDPVTNVPTIETRPSQTGDTHFVRVTLSIANALDAPASEDPCPGLCLQDQDDRTYDWFEVVVDGQDGPRTPGVPYFVRLVYEMPIEAQPVAVVSVDASLRVPLDAPATPTLATLTP